MNQDISGKGSAFVRLFDPAAGVGPYYEFSKASWTNQFHGQYGIRRLQIDAEYRRLLTRPDHLERYFREHHRCAGVVRRRDVSDRQTVEDGLLLFPLHRDRCFWRTARDIVPGLTDTSRPENHLYDTAVTAAVDLNRFWDVKVEGHFMNSFANAMYPDGFYPQQNRRGFKPNTNALVIKTGFHF